MVLKEAYSARWGWPATAAGGRTVNTIINAVVNASESGYAGSSWHDERLYESPWVTRVWHRLQRLQKGGDESATP